MEENYFSHHPIMREIPLDVFSLPSDTTVATDPSILDRVHTFLLEAGTLLAVTLTIAVLT